MRNLLIAGAMALALFSTPVVAQEECMTLSEVQAVVEGNGAPFKKVPDEELADFLAGVAPILGGIPEGTTAAIVAMLGDTQVFGLEINGCMTPPIPFPMGV